LKKRLDRNTPEGSKPGNVCKASYLIIGAKSCWRYCRAFEILCEQKLIPGDGGFEFWVRK